MLAAILICGSSLLLLYTADYGDPQNVTFFVHDGNLYHV